MQTYQQLEQILNTAELIHSEQTVTQTVQRMAADITRVLSHQQPLVLCMLGGAVIFTGQLLPQLRFPLDFDYAHLTRYDKKMQGGEIYWRVEPRESVKDRVILVLDDILDEGITLAAIRAKVLENGGNRYSYTVTTMKTNVAAADNQFVFDKSKYPGVNVEDLR